MPVPVPRTERTFFSSCLSNKHMQNVNLLSKLLTDALSTFVTSNVWDGPEGRATLVTLSHTCKAVRQVTLPVLFAAVRWPLKNRVDTQGPEFIPESVWAHIRSFSLEWPDEWSHRQNPNWGKFHHQFDADYDPSFNLIQYLEESLHKMSSIQTFRLDCPFFVPDRLYNAIFSLSDLRSLVLRDTPLYLPKSSYRCEKLENVSLSPVSEALCVGNEARDPDLEDPNYYEYPHRSKCKLNVGFGRAATKTILWQVAFSDKLSTLEISTSLCNFQDLRLSWPRLRTFIVTGPVPPEPLNQEDRGQGYLLDVVEVMPALRDLRILLGQKDGRADDIPKIPIVHSGYEKPVQRSSVLGRLRKLAVSLAVDLQDLFSYTTNLEELAVLAVAQHPMRPIAITCMDAAKLIEAVVARPTTLREEDTEEDVEFDDPALPLKRLRIIVEDEPTPPFCSHIAKHCPYLEDLELEWKGYKDGVVNNPDWDQYATALSPLACSLRRLRLGIGFPSSFCQHDWETVLTPFTSSTESDSSPCCPRQLCGIFLAKRLPAVQNIGFEYSDKQDRSDRWDEWDIHRLTGGMPPLSDVPIFSDDIDEKWHYYSPPSFIHNRRHSGGRFDIVDDIPSEEVVLELRRPVEYRFPEVWEAKEVKPRSVV